MHPIPDETFSAFLNARLDAAAEASVRAHLEACPECAARARGQLAWREELAGALDEGRGMEAPLEAMRAALPRPRSRGYWKAAAAVLLAAGAGGLWMLGRSGPGGSPGPNPRASSSLRLASSPSGGEILLSKDARLEPKDGAWILQAGACLASHARLIVGDTEIHVEGEAAIRILPGGKAAFLLQDALAAGTPSFEVAVLSGEVRIGELRLIEGEAVRDSLKRRLSVEERAALVDAVLGEPPSGSRRLEVRAPWTREAPREAYLVEVRLRTRDPKARGALVFEVDGRPSFWIPDLAADGSWHALEARVTDAWVTLSLDGAAVRRIRRGEFQPNPAAEIPGAGAASLGGSPEASGLRVIALR